MITSTQYIKRHQLILALIFLFSVCSYAQLKTEFSPRYEGAINGDFATIANNSVSEHATRDYNGNRNNNDYISLAYVDIDDHDDTFSSSSATFKAPIADSRCLTIKKAFLYWTAVDHEPGGTPESTENRPDWDFNEVKLMLPGETTYHEIKAENIIYRGREDDSDGDGIPDGHFSFDPYTCVTEITDLINTELIDKNISPFDTYQVANIEATIERFNEHGLTNRANGAGGWQIVFVYESPTLPLKNVTIFDGYGHIVAGERPIDIKIDGFLTVPEPQDVNVNILFGAIEGDRTYLGDNMQILPPGTAGNDNDFENLTTSTILPIRTVNNFFNSRITIDNANFKDRNPASENTLGFDAGIFKLNNIGNSLIGNDQTSTTIRLTTGNESYGLYLLGLSVEVFEPKLGPIEVTTDVSSTFQSPGATVTGNFVVENKGNDDAINVRIFSTLPPQLTVDFPITNLPTGVSATYDPSTGYLEFTVEDSYVTTKSTPLDVDFNLIIKDECYFLTEDCDTEFGLQFSASYRGVLNEDTQTTTSSSVVECGVGNNEKTFINVTKPTVNWQTPEDSLNRTIECNDASALSDAQALLPEIDASCSFSITESRGLFVADNSCPDVGTITNTWSFTDQCSNTTKEFTQIIIIEGSAPIVIPDDGEATVNCLANATESFAIPEITDSCGNVLPPSAPVITDAPSPLDCDGTRTYTYTFTDCSANSYEWTYIYTITTPTFTIPDLDGALTVECIDDADGTTITLPTIQDACGNELTASAPVITESPNPLTCEGTRTYTYTFTDCAGNSDEWAFVYTISTPTFTIPDLDGALTVECIDDADGTTITLPIIQDACGNTLTASAPVITDSANPFDCEGTRTYTYTFTDCAGNSDEWDFVYTIELNAFTLPTNGIETVTSLNEAVEPTPPTVNDNCGNPITPSEAVKSETPDCQGSVIYTFTYTDCANNTADWTYTYTIELAPFTVPENQTSTVECISQAIAPTPPTVNDANGDEITPVMTQSTAPACDGDLTYTFTYTDCAGNTGIWEHTYAIVTPTFTIPDLDGALTVECIDDADGTTITLPTIQDACGNELTASAPVITESPNPLTCEGTRTYTYTFTDCAGNSDEWAFVYTISTPTFTIPDLDGALTVECIDDADGTTITLPIIQDACGNTLTASAPVITDSANPFDCEGTRTYTYTFTDCAGNSDEWDFVYTIELNAFTLPTNGIETVTSLNEAVEPTPPTVNDNCGNPITPSEAVKSETPDCQGSVIYTFTYTDCANNTADWTYTYTIELAPFTVPENQTSTVECISQAIAPTPPTVNDANGDEITPVMTSSTAPECEGDLIYTFTYTDCAGNTGIWEHTYAIDVTTLPTVPENQESTVVCLTDATQPATPAVNDACGNPIIPVITASADPDCEGQKIYTFTYTDCANNEAVYTYTYNIEVPDAPIVPDNEGSTVECLANATQPTAPEVTDACGNDIIPVITQNADPDCEGEKIYTFTYTDCAGNEAVYTYTYIIDVTTAPSVPENFTTTVQCLAEAIQPAAPELSNACGDDITPVVTESANPECEGQKIYTFTYTDCAGNEAVYTYTYNIELTAFILPSNSIETVDNLDDAVEPTPPTVNDNCGNPITPSEAVKSETPDCQGSVIYTFTYTDCANNTADWTYTYTIELAPFTVPENQTSTVECISQAIAPTPPTVNDANGDEITPVMTSSTAPECEGDLIYTFTYTDCAGNTGIWEHTYTIDVTTLPTVPENQESTVVCLTDATQPATPAVNDACGNPIIPVITASADPDCEGQKIYTFTYTDCANNEAVYTYTYNIEVPDAPIVPDNEGSTVECLANATQPTAPEVTDACGNDIIPVITQNADPDCEGEKIYTFTYTDCAGNEAVYTYTYIIDVTTAPSVPENFTTTVQCLAEAIQPAAPELSNACGDDITPVVTESANPECEGQKIYTFTYTDCAGNEAVYTYTYNIELTAFILPSNSIETVDNLDDAVEPTPPTVNDNCGNPIPPSEAVKSETPDCQGSVIYTFTYTDCANNTADWTYTYTIELAPFTVPENQTSTVECISQAIAPTPPTVNDANGDEITPVMTSSTAPECEGDLIYTFTYTDCAGNTGIWEHTYTIDVTTLPTVPENQESTVVCLTDATQPATPAVNDACGNPIIPVITASADPDCEGQKIYTFTYTDCANNEAVYTYTYNIEVPDAPIVPDNEGSTVECLANATQPTAPEVTDACGNDIIPVITQNADPDCEGEKIYTFTYTDCAGNEAVYTYTYTIDVTTAPSVPENFTTTVQCLAEAIQPAAPELSNACGDDITPVVTESANPECEGQKIYTFTYTDCAGNEAVYTYTYNIELTAFVLPTNGIMIIDNIDDAVEPTPPTVNDNCGNPITPSEAVKSETPDCQGSVIYTFTYTDCANNTADWTFTYTIELAPFTVPENETSGIECISEAIAPTPPTVNDANGNEIIPVMTQSTDLVCEGNKTFTFTYTDCAGNTDIWEYTYQINLTELPVVPTNTGSTVSCLTDAILPDAPVVSDTCGNAIIPTVSQNQDPNCEGDKIYTFTYTDCAGNESVYVYTYTIEIPTAPVVPENASSTVECLANATIPEISEVFDSCGNVITPVITESPDPDCEGQKVYTFTYTDCANNISVFTYTYTIDVINAPVVPDSDGSIVECIEDATQPSIPDVTDPCGNDITPVITQSPDPDCEGDKVYTFTFTDCAGNESVYVYTYTIQKTAPDAPINESTTVECIEEALQPTALVLTDACGNNITPVITENEDPVCEGEKIYTFTYTDCAGNEIVYTFTYIIKDNTPPVISIPESVTAECSDDFSPLTLDEATATDNCDPNPIITYNDVRTNGTCSGVYTIVRTWTATDACGNATSKDQVISIADTIAPTFDQETLPGSIVVECNDIPLPETLTATDNCGTAVVTVQDERIDGNCPYNYVIKRSYIATDDCGVANIHVQNITVQDTTPPVFVEDLPSPNIVVECDAIPEAIILTATDTCGNATVSVTDSRTNGNCPSNYTITRRWVATDDCGITTTHTQNIIVQDTTAPTFVDALPENITVECDMIPEASTITAIDNCGEAKVTVSDVRTDGNCPSNYIIARTYLATDECGLTTPHVQIITVQDTTAPIPTSDFEEVLDVSCTDIPEAPEMTFSDNCSSNVIQEFTETNTFDESVIADYQIIRTWTVSDACGNQEVYTQTLNVALDEIINEVVAEDICFDNGVVNLDGFLSNEVTGGSWELIEGSPVATINGSIFDPTNLDSVYSEEFNPNTEGIQYILRHTGFQSGCLNITDVIMIVDAKCRVLPCGEKDISISTAITPNGDNFNETFDIEGITLCGFVAEVKIFNRWGALVYESNEYTLGSEREGNAFGIFGKWNGSSTKASFGNNGKLPNGTYYYIINLRNSGLDPITGPVYLGTK